MFHALVEPDRLEILLCNAHHVKNVPGRKTDVADAVWLAELCEVGLLRGSFIPPPQIAAIRELARYRRTLVEERTREGQRLRKVLEDGGIKLDSVASDALGVSGRAMIEALIGGQRDPAALADLAKGTLRKKIPDLTLALAGRFAPHHAVLCRLHLDHVDHLNATIGRLDTQIEQVIAPFTDQKQRLMSIPGVGERAAQVIISEIGVDMSRFPTAAHLASWAGLCPGNHESAGKRKTGKTRHGNPHLCTALVEAAGPPRVPAPGWVPGSAAYTAGWARPPAPKRQSRSRTPSSPSCGLLTHGGTYHDLGADYYTRREDPERLAAKLKQKIEALGYTVALSPAA